MSTTTRQGMLYSMSFHVYEVDLFHENVEISSYFGRNTPLGWHSDNERLHGSIDEPYAILSLSMGCSRTFSIRPTNRRSDETHLLMTHGDLLSMNGLFQKLYQHR